MNKERFHDMVKEMVEIHDRKNRDYAGEEYLSNFVMCEWKGCLIRLTGKMSRLMDIAKTDEISVEDETVNDTLTDLAIYALITRILYENLQAGKT